VPTLFAFVKFLSVASLRCYKTVCICKLLISHPWLHLLVNHCSVFVTIGLPQFNILVPLPVFRCLPTVFLHINYSFAYLLIFVLMCVGLQGSHVSDEVCHAFYDVLLPLHINNWRISNYSILLFVYDDKNLMNVKRLWMLTFWSNGFVDLDNTWTKKW